MLKIRNLKKMALIAGVGFVLVGCRNDKAPVPYGNLVSMEDEELNGFEVTAISLPFDSDITKDEAYILDNYSSEEIDNLYQNACSDVMLSYLFGTPNDKFVKIIGDYSDVIDVHNRYVKAFESRDDSDIAYLYDGIRQSIDNNNDKDQFLLYPIVAASEVAFNKCDNAFSDEELQKYQDQKIFDKASIKIKRLLKERNEK